MEVCSSRAVGSPRISVFADERGPVPNIIEDDSEKAWQEYDDCVVALEAQLHRLRGTLAQLSPRSHMRLRDIEARFSAELVSESRTAAAVSHDVIDVEEVMGLVRGTDRVCPNPAAWRAMYLLLPFSRSAGRLERAPYPVDVHEWQSTTDLQKQLRLREQLEWAQAHGALRRVRDFLAGLQEADWQHSVPVEWPTI